MRCPRGQGGNVEITQVSRGVGGKQVALWRARAGRRQLCACLAGTKQLARMGQHSARPPGGLGGGLRPGKSLSHLFLFYFISVTLLLF